MVDGSDCFGVSFVGSSYYFYPEFSGFAVHLYTFLMMAKIFKKINNYIKLFLNFIVRLILSIVYFVLFFPLGIFIKIFTDFLEIKPAKPFWKQLKKITKVEEFLRHQ